MRSSPSRVHPRGRHGVTLLEVLLASAIMLVVLGLLWAGLRLVLRGAGAAEWRAQAERDFEAFSHVLREELRRANHLIATAPGTDRIHDPRYAALWIDPGGEGIAFRVFQADQEVEDPLQVDPEELIQDRVWFRLQGSGLVYRREGQLEPDQQRLMLEDLAGVNFSAGSSYRDMGPLGGILEVEVRMQRPRYPTQLVRELSVRVGVPVLVVDVVPEGVDFLPPPEGGPELPGNGEG